MSEFSRHVTVDWSGPIRETTSGGVVKAGTGSFEIPVSFLRRIGEPEGMTSPEELVAAAHGACYAMALNATVGKLGGKIEKTHITCTVTAVLDNGIKIRKSLLEVVAHGLSGIEASAFQQVAVDASGGCPVSNALKGNLEIEVKAKVV